MFQEGRTVQPLGDIPPVLWRSLCGSIVHGGEVKDKVGALHPFLARTLVGEAVPLGEGDVIGLTFQPADVHKLGRRYVQNAELRGGVSAVPFLQARELVLWTLQTGDTCQGGAWWFVDERLVGN